MHAKRAYPPKPARPAVTVSEEDYLQWTRRFDLLWSSATSEHDRHEMQTLIRLIEQYDITHLPHRSLFTDAPIQGDIS